MQECKQDLCDVKVSGISTRKRKFWAQTLKNVTAMACDPISADSFMQARIYCVKEHFTFTNRNKGKGFMKEDLSIYLLVINTIVTQTERSSWC